MCNILHANPGLSQSDLARITNKDKTGITRMVDLLERKGYALRKEDEHDRRAYHLYLTSQGEDLLEKLLPLARQVNQVGKAGFTQQEIELLKRLLAHIGDNVRTAIQSLQEEDEYG